MASNVEYEGWKSVPRILAPRKLLFDATAALETTPAPKRGDGKAPGERMAFLAQLEDVTPRDEHPGCEICSTRPGVGICIACHMFLCETCCAGPSGNGVCGDCGTFACSDCRSRATTTSREKASASVAVRQAVPVCPCSPDLTHAASPRSSKRRKQPLLEELVTPTPLPAKRRWQEDKRRLSTMSLDSIPPSGGAGFARVTRSRGPAAVAKRGAETAAAAAAEPDAPASTGRGSRRGTRAAKPQKGRGKPAVALAAAGASGSNVSPRRTRQSLFQGA